MTGWQAARVVSQLVSSIAESVGKLPPNEAKEKQWQQNRTTGDSADFGLECKFRAGGGEPCVAVPPFKPFVGQPAGYPHKQNHTQNQ